MKKELKAEVINNNGLADIVVRNVKTGKVVETIQTKCGYESGVTNLSRYVKDEQTIVVNGNSKNLAKSLTKKGIDFKKSPVTTKALQTKDIIKNGHSTGLKAAKNDTLFGAGISIGSNTVEVIRGEKEIGEAIADVTIDTAIAGAATTNNTVYTTLDDRRILSNKNIKLGVFKGKVKEAKYNNLTYILI